MLSVSRRCKLTSDRLRVVLTGGPGAGKTTLVQDLSRRGYQTVSESAREVIAERLSQGVPPRPGHEAFARESLRRDEKKYQGIARDTGVIFFDQSPLGAMAMINEVAPMTERDLQAALTARGEGLSA